MNNLYVECGRIFHYRKDRSKKDFSGCFVGNTRRDNFCAECGCISLLKGQEQEQFYPTLLRKNKKESKVSGNRSLHSKRFWKKFKRSADIDCGPQTMRRAYLAMKQGN